MRTSKTPLAHDATACRRVDDRGSASRCCSTPVVSAVDRVVDASRATAVPSRPGRSRTVQWLHNGLRRRAVFISYRRTDAGGYAAQLLTELQAHYGSKAIFLDHQGVAAGARWQRAIADAVAAADVVIVVVGPEWVTVESADGERRLDDPDDWVRQEVEAGLAASDTTVIPVLVGDAALPDANGIGRAHV